VIAAVEGVAMAGGFEFMLAADIALVRDDARIADNHVNYGQLPGGGSSQRLPRLLGRQRALGLLLGGERLSGGDAVALGLAHRSFAPEEFDDRVEAFVTTMAGRRRDALVGIKRLVHDGLATSLEAGLALELQRVVAHISGEAGGAGVQSFSRKGT
jgi:enoyl-CoA hydratase/carnithine racemase